MSRRNLIIGAVVVIGVIIAALLVVNFVIPSFATPSVTGVPTASSLRDQLTATAKAQQNEPTKGAFNSSSSRRAVAYAAPAQGNPPSLQQEPPLFRSCTADRGATISPAAETLKAAGTPTAPATAAATTAAASATGAATSAAVPASTPTANLSVFRIQGRESEACYQVGEIFLDNNLFNLAVGVTKSIDGEVGIDLNNVANSKIGDIVINISEFESDAPRRDGMIRQRWLESNKFPLAKLSNIRTEGLPNAAYKEGETLKFKVIGDLELRGQKRQAVFNATAKLQDKVLVVTAVADVKMTDYGVEPPDIAGMVKADNGLRMILNIVARPA